MDGRTQRTIPQSSRRWREGGLFGLLGVAAGIGALFLPTALTLLAFGVALDRYGPNSARDVAEGAAFGAAWSVVGSLSWLLTVSLLRGGAFATHSLESEGRYVDTPCMPRPDETEAVRRSRLHRQVAVGTAAGVCVAGLLFLRSGGGMSIPGVRLYRAQRPLEFQHFVRGHERMLASGRTVAVRPHLRGPRHAAIKATVLVEPDHWRSLANTEGIRLPIADQLFAAR